MLYGDVGADVLNGGRGDDSLQGGAGTDTLRGGPGMEWLEGDADADIFDFNRTSDSVKGTHRDIIKDFSGVNVSGGELDLIDLSGIDANEGRPGNQAFHFIGEQAFHHKAGELHVRDFGSHFIVEGDTDGDGKADFQIGLLFGEILAKADFIL